MKPNDQDCHITVNEGCATEPDLSQVGYTFGGWYTDSACTAGNEWNFSNRVTSNMKLYAKWSEDHFSVTFDCNDAIYTGVKPNDQDCHITLNGGCATDHQLSQVGYTFGGWYTDSACTAGNEWNFSNRVTSNMTLYAKWRAHITLGRSDCGQIETTPKDRADINSTVTITQHPYTGYVSGSPLVKDTSGKQIAVVYLSENVVQFTIGQLPVTITPVFLKAKCTISFDTQGGTPQPGDITVVYGSSIANAPIEPTRANYEFLGWFTESNGGDLFRFGEGGTVVTDTHTTLYAHWRHNSDSGNTDGDSTDGGTTDGDGSAGENGAGENGAGGTDVDAASSENASPYSEMKNSPNPLIRLCGGIAEIFDGLAKSIGTLIGSGLSADGMPWVCLATGVVVSGGLIWWFFFFAKKKRKEEEEEESTS